MTFAEILRKKRDGAALTKDELVLFANAAARGTVPDYQLSAMLMAMYLNGLTPQETADLTLAMAYSGDTADLSAITGIKGDKHSTGGVGDKTSLIVAPVAAACGLKLAKMSGRGLGHTGGTLDKLEAIPGLRTDLPLPAFIRIVNETGLCVIGATGDLCPADKALYALRDVTETVGSLPLIASSIMSKKLAGGADCLVLDVKCGSGAFMKTPADAASLAKSMVEIGKRAGKKVAAVLTNMDLPLGNNIGNALEVQEAVAILRGEGPQDLRTVALTLAAKLLALAGMGSDEVCSQMAADAITSGEALRRLCAMVKAQGGDASYILDPSLFLPAKVQHTVCAPKSGYLCAMNAEEIGLACVQLGAGRRTKEDAVDACAGIVLQKKTGSFVEQGEPLAVLHCTDAALVPDAEAKFLAALQFSDSAPTPMPLILGTIE